MTDNLRLPVRKKRVLKRNNYKNHYGIACDMPSGARIVDDIDGGVSIIYDDGTFRWIKSDFFTDDYLKQL